MYLPAFPDVEASLHAAAGSAQFTLASWFAGLALGQVLQGSLSDRFGRRLPMAAGFAIFAAAMAGGALATSITQLAVLRFVAALGMGGEWALGVALVMESWPEQRRPLLAGLIGAAANVGYCLIAVLGIAFHITQDSWRWVMMVGAAPAALTFFIRLYVPESEAVPTLLAALGLA